MGPPSAAVFLCGYEQRSLSRKCVRILNGLAVQVTNANRMVAYKSNQPPAFASGAVLMTDTIKFRTFDGHSLSSAEAVLTIRVLNNAPIATSGSVQARVALPSCFQLNGCAPTCMHGH